MNIDVSRRQFLLGATATVGVACLVPVLSFRRPDLLKPVGTAWTVRLQEFCYHVQMVGIGPIKIRKAIWPPKFEPFTVDLSFSADVADVINGKVGSSRGILSGYTEISLDFTMIGDEHLESLFNNFLNGRSELGVALNIGPERQLFGDFQTTAMEFAEG